MVVFLDERLHVYDQAILKVLLHDSQVSKMLQRRPCTVVCRSLALASTKPFALCRHAQELVPLHLVFYVKFRQSYRTIIAYADESSQILEGESGVLRVL